MIFEKRGRWKISGYAQSYATVEEAESVLAGKAVEPSKKLAQLAEEEKSKKLAQLAEDSTPYEKMIVKNICTTCDMEPCECFTYTRKMDLGD